MSWDLVDRFNLDETSGNNPANGYGGSQMSATVQNPSAGQWTYGRKNNGFFATGSRYISFNYGPTGSAYGYQFCAFIKLRSNTSGTIFSDYNSGNSQGFILSVNSGKLRLSADFEGLTGNMTIESTTTMSAGKWYAISAVWGASPAPFDSHISIYINGVQENSQTSMGSQDWLVITNTCALGSGPAGNLDGIIDEVVFYSGNPEDGDFTSLANSNYTTIRDSGAAVYTLRSGGSGDFSTWDSMALMIQSMGNINEDITLRLQGGQSFGADGTANEILTGVGQAANDKILLIETDPAEIATPATLIGVIRHNAWPTAQLKLKKLKHRCNIGADTDGIVKCIKISAEDVYAAYQINSFIGPFNDSNSGADTKNCTFAITFSYSGAHTFQLGQYTKRADSCIFLFYDASNDITLLGLNSDSRNCLAYNYAGSKTVVLGGGLMTDLIVADPQLVAGNLITAYNEAPATVLARNAHLQVSSPCCGAAYAATATATDIEGKSRA